MAIKAEILEKSRLGRVLVGRNLISEDQLRLALDAHQESGKRLGEIIIERGWISERDLNRALKQQKRTRYAAAMVAMVVTPLQPMWAVAAGSTAVAVPVPKSAASQMMRGGLQPLDDAEMAAVGGQGLGEDLSRLYAVVDAYDQLDPRTGKLQSESEEGERELFDGIKVIGAMSKVFFPLMNVIDAEIEMEGVYYDPSRVKPLLAEDGKGFNVNLPSRIDRLSLVDIRPAGTTGATMGTLHFEGIRFHENTSIVIRPR